MSEICPICSRALGRRVEKHHVVPKSKGGREVVGVHPICHRKVHRVFSNTELAGFGAIEPLRDHPDMRTFIRWLARKPPDFHAPTR